MPRRNSIDGGGGFPALASAANGAARSPAAGATESIIEMEESKNEAEHSEFEQEESTSAPKRATLELSA